MILRRAKFSSVFIVGKRFVLLLSFVILPLSVFAYAEIKRVSTRYYLTDQLTRIPEYFTGKEYTGNRIILRTNVVREGLYFAFPLDKKFHQFPASTKIILSVIHAGNPIARAFTFDLPVDRKGKKEILLGITGKDWPSAETKPIAWEIVVKNITGKLLAQKKSFLWDHE